MKIIYDLKWWYIECEQKGPDCYRINLINREGVLYGTAMERFSWVKLKKELDSPIGKFIPIDDPDIIFVASREILDDSDFMTYAFKNEIVIICPWSTPWGEKLTNKIKDLCYKRIGKEVSDDN